MHGRYYKGREFFGTKWLDMHAELMILVSEAVLPLSITAIVVGGHHSTDHAK